MNQKHLDYYDRINLGSYYTNHEYVSIVWNMISKHISSDTIVLDSSCGYGIFMNNKFKNIQIGNDIDKEATKIAIYKYPSFKFYNKNALENVSRVVYGIKEKDKLCIVGNPPYNDITSIIRSNVKNLKFNVDDDIKTRDLGMSFLLSYDKLNADYICVLHPLSYLIKKSNFNLLKSFTKNYKLIDGLIINSGVFTEASKNIQFPILIGLYKKDSIGMNYEYIQNYDFRTENGKNFKLNNFDYIDNYISKYPNKLHTKTTKDSILFYTMRDINALKRNRTFIFDFSPNAIIIDKSKLDYYVYVDVFKQFTKNIPYYFGNLSVIINNNLFLKYRKFFIVNSISRNRFLENEYKIKLDEELIKTANYKIKEYFYNLLDNHYVY